MGGVQQQQQEQRGVEVYGSPLRMCVKNVSEYQFRSI